jgi:hypothetical protein
MAMMNVSLQNNAGRMINIILSTNFTREDFTKVASKALKAPVDGFRFVVDTKQLNLENEAIFNEQKSGITDGKIIFVLERLIGGTDLRMSDLVNTIINELPGALAKIPHTNNVCAICAEAMPCLQVCCRDIPLCDICFTTDFTSKNFRLLCMKCQKDVPIDKFFVSTDFIISVRSLHELNPLLKNIDCQICNCGLLTVNDTLYPQQTCQCGRTFCFFCNKDWDDKTMYNVSKFTCHNNCFYETCITFELVPYYCKTFLVPDRRCCPKCLNMGAYGDRCKFHTCRVCK